MTNNPRPGRLSRRAVLAAAAATPLLSLADRALAAPTGRGHRDCDVRTFYVSSAGSDSATGLGQTTPWKSLTKVNQALADGTIVRGDAVRFRAGDQFFGTINSIPVGTATDPVLTFGAYGSGARPRISNVKICSSTAGWTSYAPNVWRIDLSAGSGAYTGNTASTNTNAGFIKVNGVIKAAKFFDLSALSADWDFYNDSQYLYVRLGSNPASAGDVRVAVDGNLVTAQSAVAVDGLELRGSGGHGFRTPGLQNNVKLSNTVIAEIGGSQLIYTGGPVNTRYGNGVEIWIGGSNITVTGCTISDVYDVAVTCQGTQTATQLGWSNVHVTNSTVTNCTQSFEMWCAGPGTAAGSGFTDSSFAGNRCTGAGRGWGALVRPDKTGKSTHLLFYDTQLPCAGLSITGNTFTDAAQNYTYFAHTAPPVGMVVDNNQISLKAGTKLEYQRAETIEQSGAWTAATGLDQHSTFTVV
ncbi:hypothetical protein [Kribbella sp. NPDC055071]